MSAAEPRLSVIVLPEYTTGDLWHNAAAQALWRILHSESHYELITAMGFNLSKGDALNPELKRHIHTLEYFRQINLPIVIA
jgi:hypothetical protein